MPRTQTYEFPIRYNDKTYHVTATYQAPLHIPNRYWGPEEEGEVISVQFNHKDLSLEEMHILLNHHEFMDAVTVGCQDRYGSHLDEPEKDQGEYG